MLARAEHFTPHRMALGKYRNSRRRMHRILPRLKSAALDYGHELKPAAVFISFPHADTVRTSLLDDGSQHMLQQSVWVRFLSQRIQRVGEGVQLTAGQVFRGAERLRRSLTVDCDSRQVCHLLDEVQLLESGTARFAGVKRECSHHGACGGKYGCGPACPQPMVDG